MFEKRFTGVPRPGYTGTEPSERKNTMHAITRRHFVNTLGKSAILAATPFVHSRVRGQSSPNETLNHAVIGTGGQGSGHCKRFNSAANCQLVAVCDLDPERLDRSIQGFSNESKIRKYGDYRKLLEDPSVDSVSIATCDHWHTPLALAALVAGKHVYVEKPCSHTVQETNLLVAASEKFGKCVQHGTQYRSTADVQAGVRALRDGVIGRVLTAKAINHQLRKPIGRSPVSNPPNGVDYDLWLGPAPKHDFTRNRWHYNWHWFWDYGCGDLANDGIHQLDVAIWGMDAGYPDAIVTSGGQLFYDDDHETPDTQTIVFQYARMQIIYEMRLWAPYPMEGHDNGTVFYGTDGKMEFGRRGVIATLKDGDEKKITGNGPNIVDNFIESVRANKPEHLNAPIAKGAVSANLCHLGNIGTRLGGLKLEYDPDMGRVTSHPQANDLLRKDYRAGYELADTGA